MMSRRKLFLSLVVLILLFCAGLTVYSRLSQAMIVVDVAPARQFSVAWRDENPITDGIVSTDVAQPVYITSPEMLREIMVSEGQQVSAGIPLVELDTTLTELAAEINRLEIDILKSQIKKAESELSSFKRQYRVQLAQVSTESYNPALPAMAGTVAPVPEQPAIDITPIAVSPVGSSAASTENPNTASPSGTGDTAPSDGTAEALNGGTSDDELEGEPDDNPEDTDAIPVGGFDEEQIFEPLEILDGRTRAYAGMGTKDAPYRFFIRSGALMTEDFLKSQGALVLLNDIHVLIEVREGNRFTGKIVASTELTFHKGGGYSTEYRVDESLAPYMPAKTPEVTETPVVTASPDVTGSAPVTGSPDVTGSAPVTGSPDVTGSAPVTGSPDVTGSAPVTGSPDVTGSAPVTGSPDVTGSAPVTQTPPSVSSPAPATRTPRPATATPRPTTPRPVTPSPSPLYSNLEIKTKHNEMQGELLEMKTDLKQRELWLKTNNAMLERGYIYSTVDGAVTDVIDAAEAAAKNLPLFTVVGGSGYFIKGTMNELDILRAEIGQGIDVMSWRTGVMCEGTIVDIGLYPVSSGDSSTGESRYPFTVYVTGDYDLQKNEYVEMTPKFDTEPEQLDALYLERAYVREDATGSYVMAVGADGRLERREVITGRILLGYYVEILEGLDEHEMIAFPYGNGERPGTRTRYATETRRPLLDG